MAWEVPLRRRKGRRDTRQFARMCGRIARRERFLRVQPPAGLGPGFQCGAHLPAGCSPLAHTGQPEAERWRCGYSHRLVWVLGSSVGTLASRMQSPGAHLPAGIVPGASGKSVMRGTVNGWFGSWFQPVHLPAGSPWRTLASRMQSPGALAGGRPSRLRYASGRGRLTGLSSSTWASKRWMPPSGVWISRW